ncbi:transmembrane protein 26-like [Gadus macrocephalus]|uniref:transmembrane protein 26-like n=1 Tax=Gadus macrocephalus TaxID=80720 RepID=UPI0028CB4B3E|nr:transmembrane protein 26-like [Gadus macrocephalus]
MWTFISAVFTRACFILVSLVGVCRVAWVKKNPYYWLLTLLFLPQVAEMVVTMTRRRGKDYKWYSPAILLFLISIIPSIWILELHHHQNISNEPQCNRLDSWAALRDSFNGQNVTSQNITSINDSFNVRLDKFISAVCSKEWILGLHMTQLILLIVGKWFLPIGGGVTRDELSQLLLIFVGTAADILEFTSETPSLGSKDSFQLIYMTLAVWTWSMLQFPLHLSVVNNKPEDEGDRSSSLLTRHSTDLWTITQALFIHDGPFLAVRLIVLIHFKVFNQMLVFFAIKNLLVLTLNVYRLVVICQDSRSDNGI